MLLQPATAVAIKAVAPRDDDVADAMLCIRIRTPTDPDVVREFGGTDRVRFGRDVENDLVLDSTYISRSHGELVRQAGIWWVVSWGSRTGITLRRGARQEEIPRGARRELQHGDVLQILHTHLEVGLETAEGPRRPGPADFPERHLLDGLANALLTALELAHPACAAHSRRTGYYAEVLARAVRASDAVDGGAFSDDALHAIHLAGSLHDVGKLIHGDRSAAAHEVQEHPERGARIVSALAWPGVLARIPAWIRLHHERIDGSGFPAGAGADAIPLEARILQVVDVFDAACARAGDPHAAAPGIQALERDAAAGRLDAGLVRLWLTTRS